MGFETKFMPLESPLRQTTDTKGDSSSASKTAEALAPKEMEHATSPYDLLSAPAYMDSKIGHFSRTPVTLSVFVGALRVRNAERISLGSDL